VSVVQLGLIEIAFAEGPRPPLQGQVACNPL